MKTLKLFLTIFILGMTFSIFGQSQNPGWSLPNKYYDFPSGQVNPLPTIYTNNNASNMQLPKLPRDCSWSWY